MPRPTTPTYSGSAKSSGSPSSSGSSASGSSASASGSSSGSSSSGSSRGSGGSAGSGSGGTPSGGSGGGSGGGSCPTISWSFETSGTSSMWTEHDSNHLEFRVEASGGDGVDQGICGGGTNENQQIGIATGTVTVPAGKEMLINTRLSGRVEEEDEGYDVAYVYVDAVPHLLVESVGSGLDCSFVTVVDSGSKLLAAGVHTIEVTYDTDDGWYHDTTCGLDFQITSCVLTDAP